MAAGTVLFRLNVELSDVDRGRYESFELRLAQHPSEDAARVVTRALAYCLCYEPGLEWGRGLDEPDDPALFVRGAGGNLEHWVDIGTPTADRMHRASKAAARLSIVSHKSPESLLRERERRTIHKADQIVVWLLDSSLVTALAEGLDRNSQWVVVKTNGELMVTLGANTHSGNLVETTLEALV